MALERPFVHVADLSAMFAGFGLRLMLKDMKVALQLEHAAGIATPVSQAAVDAWASAAAMLPADADHTEIARWLGYRTPDPGAEP
jgi:3-hydroxyisobutyrate dehydrogenase